MKRKCSSTSIPLVQELLDSMPIEYKNFIGHTMRIAARIHEIFQRNGMTQRDFALKIGKHEEEISKWLSGTHNFTLRTISAIEAALDEPIIKETSWPKQADTNPTPAPATHGPLSHTD